VGSVVAGVFMPGPVMADMAVPLSPATLPAICMIIVIEAVALSLFFRRTFNVELSFGRLLLTSIVANIASSFVGIGLYLFPGYFLTMEFSAYAIVMLLIALVLSTILEWLVYLMLCRTPGLTVAKLLVGSLVANSTSYLMLLGFMIGVSIKALL
jgi:hypothetical protein